jgi:hypothetical protein
MGGCECQEVSRCERRLERLIRFVSFLHTAHTHSVLPAGDLTASVVFGVSDAAARASKAGRRGFLQRAIFALSLVRNIAADAMAFEAWREWQKDVACAVRP